MAEEVDQASINVIKTLLESRNGKDWFAEYLRSNLQIELDCPSGHEFRVIVRFNGMQIQSNSLSASTIIHTKTY